MDPAQKATASSPPMKIMYACVKSKHARERTIMLRCPAATPGSSDHNSLACGISACLAPLCIGAGSQGLILNATLIGATAHAEIALLTPIRIPRVCNLPVLHSGINAPANHLHSVTSNLISSHMVVDAPRVVLKVCIHIESDLHWASSHDCLLNPGLTASSHHRACEGVLVRSKIVMRRRRISIAFF